VNGHDRPGVAGIILAAGSSERMGRTKQLLPFRGRPLLQHVIDLASSSDLVETVVVLGAAADEIAGRIEPGPGVRFARNPEHATGQASSLRAGLHALGEEIDAALVLVGDQPLVPAGAVRTILSLRDPARYAVIRAMYGGKPGHPVLLEREIWSEALDSGSDEGARSWIAANADRVLEADLPFPLPAEVDTPEDYQRLRDQA